MFYFIDLAGWDKYERVFALAFAFGITSRHATHRAIRAAQHQHTFDGVPPRGIRVASVQRAGFKYGMRGWRIVLRTRSFRVISPDSLSRML